MAKRATLRDVARRAGVTASTVSRLLNNKPLAVGVSDVTRNRVMKAVRDLDYRPNRLARGLANAQTNVLGLSMPMTSSVEHLDHLEVTYLNMGKLVSGVQLTAQSYGYEIHIFSRIEHEEENGGAKPRPVTLDLIEGLIYREPNPAYPYYRQIVTTGLPVVMIEPAPADVAVSSVSADDELELKSVVGALLRKGHERVVYLAAVPNLPPTPVLARINGYVRAHNEAGIPVDNRLLRLEKFVEVPLARTLDELLALRPLPTAMVVGRQEATARVLERLNAAGVQVPGDMEIIVIGDDRAFEWTSPTITALRLDFFKLGAVATRLLIDHVEGRCAEPQKVIVPWVLVERESCSISDYLEAEALGQPRTRSREEVT